MTIQTVANTPIQFYPPLAAPIGNGLLAQVDWVQDETDDEPDHWLLAGVQFQRFNFDEITTSAGIWDGTWNTDGSAKTSQRPSLADPYLPFTLFGADSCDLSVWSSDPEHGEIVTRAKQNLALSTEPNAGRAFATRMLADAGVLPTAVDYLAALGAVEAALRLTGVAGCVIHASSVWLPGFALANMLVKQPDGTLTTPLGTRWCFSPGYDDPVSGLGSVLIGTSAPYGWRGEPILTTTVGDTSDSRNLFFAIVEQSYVLGIESGVISAQQIEST